MNTLWFDKCSSLSIIATIIFLNHNDSGCNKFDLTNLHVKLGDQCCCEDH